MQVSGQLRALAALHLQKRTFMPIFMSAGGPQSQSGRCGEEKNFLLLPINEPRILGCPARSLGPVPTELSRLNTDYPYICRMYQLILSRFDVGQHPYKPFCSGNTRNGG
jgi:hypothetical protein